MGSQMCKIKLIKLVQTSQVWFQQIINSVTQLSYEDVFELNLEM